MYRMRENVDVIGNGIQIWKISVNVLEVYMFLKLEM